MIRLDYDKILLDAKIWEGDRAAFGLLSEAVAEGLWPWPLLRLECWVEFAIDYNQYKLGMVVILEEAYFELHTKVDRDDILDMGNDWVYKYAPDIIKLLRNRPTEHVSDNIVLGEE